MHFKKEIKPTIQLAVPVIIAQVGQMTMGLVDTFMVGKLGPEAIGSVALANAIFFFVSIFAIGLCSPLDHFVSKAMGEKRSPNEITSWRLQGLYFSILISLPLMVFIQIVIHNLQAFGAADITVTGAKAFSKYYIPSLLPFMVYFSQRQFLQATGFAKQVSYSLILGNILNISLNWVFIYGNLNMPAMGVQGSSLSSLLTRIILALYLIFLSFKFQKQVSWRLDYKYIDKLFKLGLPAGLHHLFEVGVFSLSTALASKLGPLKLAAHSIVLNLASFTFMFPLGLSSASAIRVGNYLGGNKKQEMFNTGYASFYIGLIGMIITGLFLFLFGIPLTGLFTKDLEVINYAGQILLIAALFQIFDGIQVIGAGVLRGAGETKFTALSNFIGHWLIGLPVGVYLCFFTLLGLRGLWMGLSLGLIYVSIVLFLAWRKKERLILKNQ
ncbi:MAG: MATE family efflux transporter [Oligoflexia bacterium]|nr:MATE family efflux transporter [Oligoflexia bacterium]